MHFHGLTDVGKKRKQNEDSFEVSDEDGFAILADGMGGREHGEVASSMAVDQLSNHLREALPRSIGRLAVSEQVAMAVNLLDDWIREMNLAIYRTSQETEGFGEMGTTLVCALLLDHQLVLAHVGDSRCYLYRDGALSLLTEDHSLVNSQVRSGMMTEEEARESKQKNIITRAVGTAAKVKAEIKVHHMRNGDRILMCSDGIHDMLDDEVLSGILANGAPLEEVARTLVDAANAAGGRDNITVILGAT